MRQIAGAVIESVEFAPTAYVCKIRDGRSAPVNAYRQGNGGVGALRGESVRTRTGDGRSGRRRAVPAASCNRGRGQAIGQIVVHGDPSRGRGIPDVVYSQRVGARLSDDERLRIVGLADGKVGRRINCGEI